MLLIDLSMEIVDALKVFIPSAVAFFVGISLTPALTHFLYKHKMWKKKPRTKATGGGDAPIFNKLHKERDVGTPRMGGIIIWASVLITITAFWLLSIFFPTEATEKLNFLSRNQTWLPIFTLIVASLLGLVDDFVTVTASGGAADAGMSLRMRIALVLIIGFIGGWWFFAKLGVTTLFIPLLGDVNFGVFIIPFFMLVMLALFSGGVIDGIDGLSGGIMSSIFAAYAAIAFFQGQIDLAVFSAVIVGGTLAFLWFNIPPARFYMTETGILGLTTTLTVVAFLTDAVSVLPVIAFLLLVAPASSTIQILSKKLRGGKKVFLVAPIHHHFEALGWPAYKVTMRFWIIGIMLAIVGTALALV